jgi:iduronate 2-sulfatase
MKQFHQLAAAIILSMGVVAFASAKSSPNVLFITIDDLNNDLGTYGHSLVKSPHIDELASQGIRFDNAYVQAPQCTPSRSSFLTGLYPEQTGVVEHGPHFRDLIPGVTTLPQLFKESGYFSARVGKIFHYGVPSEIGTNGLDDPMSWDEVVNPSGIDKVVESHVHSIDPDDPNIGGTLTWLKVKSRDEDHTDGKITIEAVKLLQQHHPDKTGKPFFIGVGYFRPHVPFIAPEKYFDLYPLDRIQPFQNPTHDRDNIPLPALADRPHQLMLSDAKQREIIQAYYASVSYVDEQVGILLSELERLNLTQDTIVVLLSDHGYHLGHHGLWQKADLFEGGVRAPLIIVVPGNPANGKATSSLVEFVDIYPTLVDLAGLKKPAHLAGRSLLPIINDPAQSVRGSALTLAPSFTQVYPELQYRNIMGYSIRTPRYRYTQWGPDGVMGEELYDYVTDPGEFNNLVRAREYKATRFKLQRLLRERVAEARIPATALENKQ